MSPIYRHNGMQQRLQIRNGKATSNNRHRQLKPLRRERSGSRDLRAASHAYT